MVNGADIAIDGIVMVYQYGISMIYIYISMVNGISIWLILRLS